MSRLRTVSWVILAVVGALTLLGSLASAVQAYRQGPDQIGPVSLEQLGGPGVATAIRARRSTAAAYAAGYAVLFLFVVLGPYRRGETWAWWAVLAGTLTMVLLIVARVPFLDTRLGTGAASLNFGLVALALLLDMRRLRGPAPAG